MTEPNYIPCPPPDPKMVEHWRWLQNEQRRLDASLGIPERLLTGYTSKVVYAGECMVEGCTNEALVFCEEHKRSDNA